MFQLRQQKQQKPSKLFSTTTIQKRVINQKLKAC